MSQITLLLTRNLDSSDILDILLENGVCQCQRCDELELEDNATSVQISEYGGRRADCETWCEDCTDDHSFCCDSCGSRVSDEYRESGTGYSVCRGCYENGYFYCEGCNDLFSTDDMASCEDGCYCSGCVPEESDDDDDDDDDDDSMPTPATLENATGCGLGGYHADSIRSSWTIPIGAVAVEIEITTKNRNRVANWLRSNYGCACERDGSLSDSMGMEIITKPEVYPQILGTLRDMLGSLKTMKIAKGWDNGKGYGIHVNLDARLWSETKRAAFCAQFGESNRHWLELVAGRDETQWARYKRNDSETIETDKYSASAMKSGGRMEVRIFRSTLKIETALGYVALCKDIERFVDCDLFRRPKDLLFWLVRNGSKETRHLLADKIPGQTLGALIPSNENFGNWLVDCGFEVGQN